MSILKTANTKGKYYDTNAKEDVINYITSPKKTLGDYIGSKNLCCSNFSEEMMNTSKQFGKDTGVQLRHFVVAFDENEVNDPTVAFDIGDKICDVFKDEYQCVFGVHEDTKHLHVHIAINSTSFVDGHRYKGTRQEFNHMKNHINKILKEHNLSPVKYVSNKKNDVFKS